MRLLHTTTLHFEEFYDKAIPKYAILSHRWDSQEVSLQEFLDTKEEDRNGKGWSKIKRSCQLADSREINWMWIDTCCIDKKSSAELSEAINSMYRWYMGSFECYAFVLDVQGWPDMRKDRRSLKAGGAEFYGTLFSEHFGASAWFSRGWTLQELLAPSEVRFYDAVWEYIGDRTELGGIISEVTGILPRYLSDIEHADASVATRMSWASKRQCSRVEDIAYSLLGIFDVNMPLLYGEGKKAFIRLQLEIIRKSDDESIFAWVDESAPDGVSDLLADRPTAFLMSHNINNEPQLWVHRDPYVMTNRGLSFNVPHLRCAACHADYGYELTQTTTTKPESYIQSSFP